MPVKVIIKGIGNVKFPDGMTDDAIERAVREGLRKGDIEAAAGLPMDEASRMARAKEMGFDADTTWYHGSRRVDKIAEHGAFNDEMLGSYTGAESASRGHFFSDNPRLASTYADATPEQIAQDSGPLSYGLEDAQFELEKFYEVEQPTFEVVPYEDGYSWTGKRYDRFGDEINDESEYVFDTIQDAEEDLRITLENEEADLQMRIDKMQKQRQQDVMVRSKGAGVIPARLRMENPFVYDFKGGDYRDQSFTELIDEAIEDGHDSVIFENVADAYDGSEVGTVAIALDPKQIRSEFAAFDKTKKDSSDLLAGLKGAAPLAGAAALAGGSEEAEASFAGKLARTADTMMLDVAQKMERSKIPRDEIWQKTGWFKGPDGEWRFEVDDSAAKLETLRRTPENTQRINELRAEQDQIKNEITEFHRSHGIDLSKGSSQLDDLPDKSKEELQRLNRALRSLERQENAERARFIETAKTAGQAYENPALYQAYPDLQDVGFNTNPEASYMGQYSPKNDEISINTFYPEDSQRSTMAHELQHAIQRREGFAPGSNTELAALQLNKAEQTAKNLKESVDRFDEGYRRMLDREGYTDALELSDTAWKLKEIDRLRDYMSSDRLTNKRRHIFNSGGAILDPNIEHRIRMDINWPKRHRPQAERDAAFAEYIGRVIGEAEASLDPKRVEQVRNVGVADPHAKFQRQARRIREKAEQSPVYESLQSDKARVRELNDFLDRYEGLSAGERDYSLYRDTAGEVEARLVQERLDMTPEQRKATPPWRSKAYQETPEYRQALVEPGGNVRLPSQRGAATPAAMGATAAGALAVLPGLQATKETLQGVGAYGEAIARSLAGMALGGVQTLGDTWNPGAMMEAPPFTRAIQNMEAGVDTMTRGMEFSPGQRAGMQRIADAAGNVYDAAPEALQWAIRKYIEGMEPAAQAAEYIGEHHGVPKVGQEVGNALRLSEFAMP